MRTKTIAYNSIVVCDISIITIGAVFYYKTLYFLVPPLI